VILLWLSLAMGIPTIYLEYQRVTSAVQAVVLTVFMSVLFAVAVTLNVNIARGRNWARWCFFGMVLLTLASYLLPDDGTRVVSWIESALSVASLVLDSIALYLLFSWPGALWFRPRT
jgi:hypothetical protein